MGPRIPNFIREIQFVKYYLFNPCEVPLSLYFETARPITGEIAIALLGFDFIQFVKTIFKPKWMRSGRHTRRGPRGKRKGGGIPEIADLAAEIMDPEGHLKKERWPLPAGILLEISEVVDRAFWTVFLVEAYETLFVNTIIGVIEADKKGCPSIGRASRQDNYIVVGGAGPEDRSVNVATFNYQNKVDTPTGFGASIPKGQYIVMFVGDVRAEVGDIEFTPAIHVQTGGEDWVTKGGTVTLDEGQKGSFSVSATINGPAGIQWKGWILNNFAELTRVRVLILQTGD